MLKRILFICLSFFNLHALAQHYPDSIPALIPNMAIKFSPFHLLSFYPSVQFAAEYKIARRYSMQTDLGYVYNGGRYWERYQNKRGIKFRQEIRRYFDLYHKKDQVYYYSFEAFLNVIDFNRTERKTECFDLDCMIFFQRTYHYLVRYRESGFNLKYGFQRYYSRNLFIDFNFGLALRFIRYHKPDIPRGFNEFDGIGLIFGNFINEENRIVVRPAFSLRLGYRFK